MRRRRVRSSRSQLRYHTLGRLRVHDWIMGTTETAKITQGLRDGSQRLPPVWGLDRARHLSWDKLCLVSVWLQGIPY